MVKKGISLTTQVIILVSVLLLVINTILGVFLIIESRNTMMELVIERMLDLSNTAAALIDGDEFEDLTVEDVEGNTERYKKIYRTLEIFQNNIKCKYIYSIKKNEEGKYVYVIDPDPVDPNAFGVEFLDLSVLSVAFSGKPSIDEAAVEDDGERLYSSFSPIKNGHGEVVGVIGVDFSKDWVDARLLKNTLIVVFGIVFSLIIGGIIVMLFTSRVRNKLRRINSELSLVSVGIEGLNRKIAEDENYNPGAFDVYGKKDETKKKKTDDIEAIGAQLHAIQSTLGHYIEYMNIQAYTDKLTGARNSTAYYKFCEIIERKMEEGKADFAIMLFDINALKRVNDGFGHIVGDKYIVSSANIMMKVLGKDKVYRLGGDEFVCIIEGISEQEIKGLFLDIDKECAAFNEKNVTDFGRDVAFSKGFAIYDPKSDKEFKDVFRRADLKMYEDKNSFYENHPRE